MARHDSHRENARRRSPAYRVRGTAGAYVDRDRLLTHGRYTISRDVTTEAEAQQLAAQFMSDNKPQGKEARVWIEKTSARFGPSFIGRWSAVPDGPYYIWAQVGGR